MALEWDGITRRETLSAWALAPLTERPLWESVWLAVPGMHGGFKYWRVVGGSGERHAVSPEGWKLVPSGFV